MIPLRPVNNDDTVASPCARNCCLNGEDICVGCGRLLREITSWMNLTAEQKRVVIATASERLIQLHKQWE